MRDLAIGGLASGLPTNDIVDAYAASLNIPIDAANKQVDLLKLNQDIYRSLNTKMQTFKNNLIDLNLSATFNSKVSTNSNPSVLSFTPSATTPIGSYMFDVLQLAEPSRASSIFTTGFLSYKGGGIESAAGRPSMYDQVEGSHNVTIRDLGYFSGAAGGGGGGGGGGDTPAIYNVSPFSQSDAQSIKVITDVPIDGGGGGGGGGTVYYGGDIIPGYQPDGSFDPILPGNIYANKQIEISGNGTLNPLVISFGIESSKIDADMVTLTYKINEFLRQEKQIKEGESPITAEAYFDADANGWRVKITDSTPAGDTPLKFSFDRSSGVDFGFENIDPDTYVPPTEQKEADIFQRFMFGDMGSFLITKDADSNGTTDDGVVAADTTLSYTFDITTEKLPKTTPATTVTSSISISFDIKEDDTVNMIMDKMASEINDQLNADLGTSGVKYVVPAVERAGQEFKLGLYGGSSEYKINTIAETSALLGGINASEESSVPTNFYVDYTPGTDTGGSGDDGTVSGDGDVWVATDVFEFENGKVVTKHTNGFVVDPNYIDTWGRIAFPNVSGIDDQPIEFIIDGVTLPPIKLDIQTGQTLTEILSNLEDELNDQINALKGTGSLQYISMKAERDATSGTWLISTYDVSGENLTIAASLNDPKGTDSLAVALGFLAMTETKTQTMVNMVAETSSRNLELRLGAGIEGTDEDPSFSVGTGADGYYLFDAKNASLIRNVGFATPNYASADHSSDPTNALTEGGFVYETTSRPGDLGTVKSVYTSGNNIFNASSVASSSYREILNGRTIADLIDNGFFNNNVSKDDLFSFEETEPIDTNGDGVLDGEKVLYNYGILEINNVQIKIRDNMTLSEMMGVVNSNTALDLDMYFDDISETFVINSPNGTPVKMTGDFTVGAFNDLLNMRSDRGATFTQGFTSPQLDADNTLSNVLPGFQKGIFTINDVSIYYDPATDTLNDVMDRVNRSNANVVMSFNSATQSISLASTDGTDLIKLGSEYDTPNGNFLEVMNLSRDATKPIYSGSMGQGAEFDLNGVRHTSKTNDISDMVEGANITLYSVGISVVDVKVDTDVSIDAMANFISSYNEIMNYLTADTAERKRLEQYKNPLTAKDIASMTDKEVENYRDNWEKYHTADIILGEATMRSIRTKLRTLAGAEVQGTSGLNFLSDLDIRILGTGDDFDSNLLQKGLLLDDTTDVDDIKKLLEKNDSFMNMAQFAPNALHKFFSETETIGDTTRDIGFSRKFNTYVTNTTSFSGPIQSKIKVNGSIDKHLEQLYDSIATISRRNEQTLRSLSERFVNMEVRVSQLQAQADYLAQNLN